jgi:hypothetical protein
LNVTVASTDPGLNPATYRAEKHPNMAGALTLS